MPKHDDTIDGEVLPSGPPPYIAEPSNHNAYSDEKADYICRQVAAGRSLSAICREPSMPAIAVIQWWAKVDYNGFRGKLREARGYGLQVWADEIVAISDDGHNDTYIDENGKVKVDQDVIARSHLRIRSRQWMLAKHMPHLYGERVQVDKNVNDRRKVDKDPKQLQMAKSAWVDKHGNGENWAKYNGGKKGTINGDGIASAGVTAGSRVNGNGKH